MTLLLLAWVVTGCATYSEGFVAVERQIAARQYDDALASLDRLLNAPRDQALALLNKGMILSMRGDYVASNEAFEAAKVLMRSLSAVSVSEQAASLAINDATRAYEGEDHEQVLVLLYKAMNYLVLGSPDEARVEILQADVKLREMADRHRSPNYLEDAFARYLAGMLYEQLGEWSDALISYRKAYEAYRRQKVYAGLGIPQALKEDLLRLTERQGLDDENKRFQAEFGISTWMRSTDRARLGEVVFILHDGFAPILHERSSGFIDAASNLAVTIAVPYYQSRPAPVARVEVSAGAVRERGAVVEDIDAIARDNLEARMPAIIARSIARQVVKHQMARKAQQAAQRGNRDNAAAAGLIAGLAVNVFNVATERADTRSWTTLPREIHVARLVLPPGRHDVEAQFLDATGAQIATHAIAGLLLRAGGRTYVMLHRAPNQLAQPRR